MDEVLKDIHLDQDTDHYDIVFRFELHSARLTIDRRSRASKIVADLRHIALLIENTNNQAHECKGGNELTNTKTD